MKRFMCAVIGFGAPRKTERLAPTSEAAAEQCAKAKHSECWVQPYRRGNDFDGQYDEYTVHFGRSVVATVRVYPMSEVV